MENINNIDPLDDWLKSMKDATSEPSAEVWESLSERIPAKPQKRRLGILWLSLLGLGLVGTMFLFLTNKEVSNSNTTIQSPQLETPTEKASEPIIAPSVPSNIKRISVPSGKNPNEVNRPTAFSSPKSTNQKSTYSTKNSVKNQAIEEASKNIELFDSNDSSKEIVEKIRNQFYQKHTENIGQIQQVELKKIPQVKTILAYNNGTPKGTLSQTKTKDVFPLLSVETGVKINQYPIHKLLEIDDRNIVNRGNPIQTYEMGIQMNFEINPKWMVSWNVFSRKNVHFEIISQPSFAYSHDEMETDLRGKMIGEFEHDLGALELRSTLVQAAGTYYPEGDPMSLEYKLVGDWRYKRSSFFVYRRFYQNEVRLSLKMGVGLNTLEQSKMQVHAVRYFDSRITDARVNVILRDLKQRFVDGTFGLDIEKPILPYLSVVFAPEINVALSPILNNHSNLGFGFYGGLRYRIR